jgi:DNA-binding MarR family transcriptional regulator
MSLDVPSDAHPGDCLPEKHGGDLGLVGPALGPVRAWLRLLTCAMAIDKRLRTMLAAEHQTTLPRFDVLAALDRAPAGLTMSDLSSALLVSNGNVTALVQALTRDGLVATAPAPSDRRAQIVTLTRAGRAAFARQSQAHHALVARLLGGLAPLDLSALHALLGRVKASVAAA